MERSVKELLGGGLRPNDPRRFLIEAMIGAMSADGVADARESAAIERQIANHPLFQGLGPGPARTLIDLSNDAIRFAGTPLGRAPAIAKGLPARIHRVAAYGMAAEVAVADAIVAEGELHFLEALRIALRIAPMEAEQIVIAARAGRLEPYLEDRFMRIKSLISIAAEVFALRALARGAANDDMRFKVRDFFFAIPDLQLTTDELDGELFRAFRRPRAPDAQVFGELARVAAGLPDPVDRYWMVVYTLVAEVPATVPSWRVIPFMGVMQAAFQITDTDMELAVVDALTFPPALPRPS
ncbi:MAG: TerB family tellurite resistance protein [Deltaproteobacteria bacterium]|nr:TerB family tellurite resistance protein [Deltaproteobacteria bacterium]MCW5808768.1 TerB family tellurite resistance protein [Deltaproteobacteria bacterium]